MSFVKDGNSTSILELFIKNRILEKTTWGKVNIMSKTDKCRCWTNDKDAKTEHMHNSNFQRVRNRTQPAFSCSKLTIETLEQGVKYVQS